MNNLVVWSQFILSALLVIAGGSYLARQGKSLARRWHLTELWVGFIFLAAVTSIPELATALGAALVAKSSSLALGDILGSNAFNLFIIAFLNLAYRGPTITATLSSRPFRLLFFLILIMTVIVLGSVLLGQTGKTFAPGGIDFASWSVLLIYLAGSWLLFRGEHPRHESQKNGREELSPEKEPAAVAFYFRIGLCVLAVVGGGFWLARTGREISEITGWGQSFVGALFLALITSLPELSVCLVAVKIGANEMALGNILGSNVFNLAIIFWADLAYRTGSILSGVDPSNFLAGFLSMVLLLIVALALKLKPSRFLRFLSWDTLALIFIYLTGIYFVFRISSL